MSLILLSPPSSLCHSTTLLLSVIHSSSSASLPRGPVDGQPRWPQGPPSQTDRTNPLAWPSDTLTWQTGCQADWQAADAAVSQSAPPDAQLALRLGLHNGSQHQKPCMLSRLKVNEKRDFTTTCAVKHHISKTEFIYTLTVYRLSYRLIGITSSSYISYMHNF